IIDLMIAPAEQGGGRLRAEIGLAPPRFRTRQKFELDAERLLEGGDILQHLGIVAGERDAQRAFAAIADRLAGSLLDRGGEARPQRLAGAVEGEQKLLAGLGLDAG